MTLSRQHRQLCAAWDDRVKRHKRRKHLEKPLKDVTTRLLRQELRRGRGRG
jgi:hypothetical protein